MYVKRISLQKELKLIVVAIIACTIVIFSNSLYLHILSLLMVCVTAIILVNGELMHPYFWFSAFFGLYSCAYPLMLAMGITAGIGYTKSTMLYQLLALITALLIIGPDNPREDNSLIQNNYNINLGVLNKIIYILLIALIICGALFVYQSGFSGKDDIYNSGNKFLIIIFRLPLILTMLYTLSVMISYSKYGKFPVKQTIITLIALVLITLFSGERDFIFRFLMVNIFVLWFIRKVRIQHLIAMVPVLALLLPLSSTYKYYFLTGTASITNNNIIYSFLSGEFESAARNMQKLINNSSYTMGVKGLKQIGLDLLSVFDSSIKSPTAWFNNTYYPTSKTQYGFTLVGEGYIIAGTIGIVLVFVIVGLIIRLMYKKAYNNIYSLAAYIYFITIIIYSIRADLSTVYAALIKQVFMVLFILRIMEKLSKRKRD